MEIQLLRSEGCHTWEKTLKLLNEIRKEKDIDQKIETVMIDTQEKAEKYRYFGSPQVNLDGRDIDPMAQKVTSFKPAGCRFYLYEGETYEYPPKKMMAEAIERSL